MIGKIVTGKSFGGAVRYLLGKEPGKAYILMSDGVELTDRQALIGSFEFQRRARPDVERVVGHISLSFHPDDDPRMSNQLMIDLARAYMQRMEITGTQYLVVRHTDTKHPHLHILYNRVRYDTTLVPDRNERLRNMRICRELKQEYGLTFSRGKEQVATERLHGPEQLRHRIYDHLREMLPVCTSWTALVEELSKRQVATTFVHRGGDPTKEIQGVTFTLEGHTFKASQVDRKFSYGRLTQRIEQNRLRQAMIERVRNYADEQRLQVAAILQKLESEKQRQQQPEPPRRNLSIAGKPLTKEQIEMLREGEPIYVRGTQSEGYVVMDDQLQMAWVYQSDPRDWVEYGKYTMRRMDRDRIEAGYVVRTLVNGGEARRHVPTCGRRRHRIRPTGRVGTIPANLVLPRPKSSRTGHAALSPRRRNRAARAGNEILSDTRVCQLELKVYLYRAIPR